MFFHCWEIKTAYVFWFVLAKKSMSPTGTVPAITKLTCADMIIGMKDQPRSDMANTLASMLLYPIWVARNKTVHREGLCDREGAVAMRIQLYFYSYLPQDPPPLDLSLSSFLTFLHHGIEAVERHLL